jgi:tetratricopeptide (TPR) repeat protein
LEYDRSLNLLAKVGLSVRDAFLKSRLAQVVAVVIALCILGAPPAWIHRDDIRRVLGLTVPLPEQKSLVILPFRVISGDQRSLAFADGITETLTAKLTQLTLSNLLQVAPTTDVRGRGVTNAAEARRELGANLVLEGTLQFFGAEGRATFALIDARTHRQLRGDEVTAKADDAFVFQDRIVDSVLRILELHLGPAQRESLSEVGSTSADAYGFYVQATGYLYGYQANSVDNAILLFRRAIKLDPNLADAHAGLGQAYWIRSGAGKDPALAEDARRACENAVDLNPKSAPAHICLGTLHTGTGKYEDAVADFRKAAEIERSSDAAYRGLARAYELLNDFRSAEATYLRAIEVRPHYWASYQWLGRFYMYQARYREAVERYKQASDLTPDNHQPLLGLGSAYYYSGRFPEAMSVLNRANEISPTAAGYQDLGFVYLALRQFDQATRSLERAMQLDGSNHTIAGNLAKAYYWSPGGRARGIAAYREAIRLAERKLQINPRDPDAHILLARFCAFADQKEKALTHLNTALELRSNDSEYAYIAAIVHCRLGDRPAALQWLEKSVRGGYSLAEIQSDPDLDSVRNDPDFLRLLK